MKKHLSAITKTGMLFLWMCLFGSIIPYIKIPTAKAAVYIVFIIWFGLFMAEILKHLNLKYIGKGFHQYILR